MADTASTNSATPKVDDRARPIIYVGLYALAALAPLPLGSARPLAWDVLSLIVALLLLATALLSRTDAAITREGLVGPLALFVAVIAFALVQAMPDVPAMLRNPVWDQAADSLGVKLASAIAADPGTALVHVLRLLTYAGVFYLAVLVGRDAQDARRGLTLVVLTAAVYGTYGLLVYWSGDGTILWYSKWAYLQDVTGPFVNRNSFATYLGLATLSALALTLESFARIDLRGLDVRRKLAAAIEFVTRRTAILLIVFVLVTALLLTHSRGGFTATIFGALVLFLMLTLAPGAGRMRRVGAWTFWPSLIVLTLAIVISGSATLDRFTADIDTNTRLIVNGLVLQAIRDYPLTGIGLGSFTGIFPIYRTAAVTGYFDLAHNDYLQNILELGIPAASCLFVSLGWIVLLCLRGVCTRQRDVLYPCLGVAATGLVALHATVDFSLQIPAVTITYLFLLGIAVAQSVSSRKSARN